MVYRLFILLLILLFHYTHCKSNGIVLINNQAPPDDPPDNLMNDLPDSLPDDPPPITLPTEATIEPSFPPSIEPMTLEPSTESLPTEVPSTESSSIEPEWTETSALETIENTSPLTEETTTVIDNSTQAEEAVNSIITDPRYIGAIVAMIALILILTTAITVNKQIGTTKPSPIRSYASSNDSPVTMASRASDYQIRRSSQIDNGHHLKKVHHHYKKAKKVGPSKASKKKLTLHRTEQTPSEPVASDKYALSSTLTFAGYRIVSKDKESVDSIVSISSSSGTELRSKKTSNNKRDSKVKSKFKKRVFFSKTSSFHI